LQKNLDVCLGIPTGLERGVLPGVRKNPKLKKIRSPIHGENEKANFFSTAEAGTGIQSPKTPKTKKLKKIRTKTSACVIRCGRFCFGLTIRFSHRLSRCRGCRFCRSFRKEERPVDLGQKQKI